MLREIGKENEAEFLGAVAQDNPAYLKLLKKHGLNPESPEYDEHGKPAYLSFKDAVKIARESQPWQDPHNPEKDFLRDLRLAVADELGVPEAELERVRAYTAVGSPLDRMHGINFFVEDAKPGGRIPFRAFGNLVTADFEKKRKKKGVVYVNARTIDNPENTEGEYLKKIGEIAKQIANAIREKEKALKTAGEN